MRNKIAFVTSSVKPDFTGNDLIAVESLKSLGVEVTPLPWDVETTAWSSFDLVVLRSCWNYHLLPEKFEQWLERMEKEKVKLSNSSSIVRWNLHKEYLQELEEKGVSLLETVWAEKGCKVNLSSILKEKKWEKAVVKPAISAGSFNTFLISKEGAEQHQQQFESLVSQYDLLIQKFMPEIQTEGEWSLIFFNKKFSHAVIKRPVENEFRVQHDFGGTATHKEPSSFLLKQAEKILSLIEEHLLYARVDGVISDSKFLLMELELIEPVLFLDKKNGSADSFAQAMTDIIKNNNYQSTTEQLTTTN
jgi:glutathione synthase/RimK-type ligase-like ATP-grasp enzyme